MNRKAIFSAGNVAVVTGAGLGIGKAMAMHLAETGMSVVMADLESDDFDASLESARKIAKSGPQAVLGVVSDVSEPEQVARLRDQTMETFGKINFLANNAVTRIGRGFDAELDEWRRAIDVNLWGPILGVRTFLPAMLDGTGPGAIVNVGSKQGITNPPGHPIYNIAKSAIKTYTEALQHQLRNIPNNQGDGRVSAHLLIPGWTTSGKAAHKPGAWLPKQVVDMMVSTIARDSFYILCPDDEVTPEMDRKRILWGAEDIIEDRPPLSRWHPDFAELAKAACS